ncbi:methylcytosine dioxygenase TET3 isoform X2 [Pygocentrus nattereri]|uniref:methylcytosine dioxygenase TET3 isoform X2 n=1 Tax=Pygocentrus nattereri TaxID=42514 RepID=UPI0018913212|nr:methylcytosine dioxygenase TET3 isoform X2 [Pygocentrus nattereri]
MHKLKAGPGPPAPDVYEFSMDQEDGRVLKVQSAGVESPLAQFIQTEHQHAGLFALPQQEPPGPKKKRKRCGMCGPCMLLENCGTCSNCLNRKVGHQICKLRKCEELKRRRSPWQVEYCEDSVKACTLSPNLATETVSKVGSVDGPRGSGQMEIDHDRLEKGVLNQEPSNGLNQHAGNGEETDGLDGGDLAREQHQQNHHHQETLACLPQGQEWGTGHHVGDPNPQQQQAGWSEQTTGSSMNSVDMEDARTLVAFSASASSLSTCNVSQPSQNPTAQLYERFIQEMSDRGGDAKEKGWSGDGEHCTPEDLNILQMALNQARHGHKPPNCDCDGPDCPDYLEWLEKKIRMAANTLDKGLCKMSGAPQTQQQHYQSQPQPQPTDANPSCGSESQSQDLVNQPPVPRPYGPPAPIPCSPSVLSIAKERNVSLQTAIAIEALTQLSGTGGALGEFASGNSKHHASPQTPSQSQNGMQLVSPSPGPLSSSSPMPQSVPPGHFHQQDPPSWEQHRPQSQGPVPHSSQYRSPRFPSTASPFPQQWQQGTGASCEKSSPRNPWMMLNSEPLAHVQQLSQSGNDPMSELKQLLGDTSGKYANAAFKFPAQPQNLKDSHKGGHSVMPYVKQEVDNGEYPAQACATMGQFGMVNGQQQQFQGQQLPQSIRHSTQAALQNHLHHKRNLFSSPSPFSPQAQMACQTLRKWWPQNTQEGTLAIKQEPKEPRRKKNAQSSPLLKQPMGGLLGSLAPPLPKPKQIIIKKPKQKASQPVFHPQSQISIQKPLPSMQVGVPSQLTPSLPGMEAGLRHCLSSYNPSQVAMSQAAPAQSQESILNSSYTPISGNTPPISTPVSVPLPPAQEGLTSSGLATAGEAATSTPQTSTSQPTPPLAGLGSLDPKFEELIRQFEEEFGDTLPSAPVADAPEQGPAPSVVTESQQNSNSGQARPQSPSTEQLTNPLEDTSSQPEPMQEGEKERELDSQAEGVKEDTPVSLSQLVAIKQEVEECKVDVKPSGPLLSQAHEAYLQQQQHRVLVDPFTTSCTSPTKRMKIESSGNVTVLSTTGCFSTAGDGLDTPTKEDFPLAPSLKGFLESPLRYLDTPTKSLLDTPVKDSQAEFPLCDCVDQILEKDEGPYYNHLGSGPTVASIRELMESRFGEKGDAIRIEKVLFTGREGKSSQGCPIAKWVIRRSSEKEKLLCLVRHRAGHHCANAVIIILILAWEGVPKAVGDKLYKEVSETLTKYGNPTSRRCGLNDDRTCACQGKDTETCGASFSFGCSWSMYFNGCKYARSKTPRKFRLQGEHPKEEELLRDNFQDLATRVAPLYKRLAPKAYSNQCANEKVATDCRLGLREGRPFSGITACMDFCAHAHKDQHNLHNGCTVVCTLTKEDNRQVGVVPDDEQLHVLPLYKISPTDEFGSEENQRLKIQTGAIHVLSSFRREVRKLPEPAKSCRQRRLEAKKAASEKKNKKQQLAETPEKMIKKEVRLAVSPHLQQGNKVPKQEVKPTIKKELVDRFQAMNGDFDGYPALGNGKMCPNPYRINGAYSYPGPYARGGLPSNGQPSAPSPVNGFHPNLQGMPYNYYNYPPNALLPPEVLSCEGRNGTWPKAAAAEQKPDIQGLQARLAQAYPNRSDQQHQQVTNLGNPVYLHQSEVSQSPAPPNHTPSATPDQHRVTPVIKQEPMEVPLYESRTDGQVRSCPTTPSATPQPDAWPGHKANGSLASKGWDGNLRPGLAHSAFTPDKQQLHQQHHTQPQHPQYAHPQHQWSSFPGTPMASPSPSPSPALKAGPSPAPSPHPGTPLHWDSPVPSPQPKAWGPIGSAGFNPGGLRQGTPVGAFPDRMLSQVVESRGSTPLGLQEKAWKSGGASAAGNTPSPAPEGRLFPDALQKADGQACWEMEAESQSEREPEEEEVWSDSEHNFLDPNIGGVAVAPGHGSILIECARRELHATTPLKKPDRSHPTRISLVFYQHKNLNQPCHGLALWEAKMKLLAERARQRQQEAALLGLSQEDIKAYSKKRKWADGASSPSSGPTKDKREGVVTRLAPTHQTTTMVTVSPYAFTQLTGPYSRFM